jgi:glycosyltransferase involved in cell wall biosynthesis
MRNDLKISVITVCYSSAEHIADSIRSVDAQTWPHVEHLVVDGASKDGTIAIVNAHLKPGRRLLSEPDRGIYDAMNKGLSLVSGDVIGFLNSDDLYPTADVLAHEATTFEYPLVDACYGDLCYVKQHDTNTVVRYWRSSTFQPDMFLRGWCPPHPTLFLRRRVYERIGHFDIGYKIAADVDLMAKAFEVHRVRSCHIPKVLVRMRTGGASNKSIANVWQQDREIWHSLNRHGLAPSLSEFVFSRLMSRGTQFLFRPS